jgi:hypothetical protein
MYSKVNKGGEKRQESGCSRNLNYIQELYRYSQPRPRSLAKSRSAVTSFKLPLFAGGVDGHRASPDVIHKHRAFRGT